MKVLNKYRFLPLLLVLVLPISAFAKKSAYEKSKTIVKEFDVTASSMVLFKHRRGSMEVRYVDGNIGKVEATVIVKGDDEADVQVLLDAMEIETDILGDRTEINTGHNIKSWSSSNGIFWSRHKIVLKSGREITSRVEQVTINAILYLPKVKELSLNLRYDDIKIESCQAAQLNVDIHSGKLRVATIGSNTYVKVKYGEVQAQQLGDLKLESHDSKGTIGNLGSLVITDKYSEFTFGNLGSLEASLHDGELTAGNVTGDANIQDKYSEIQLGNIENGNWSLHDSDIKILNAGDLKIKTKYTNFKMQDITSIKLNAHDDNFILKSVGDFKIIESKYSEYEIQALKRKLDIDYSHDDDFEIEESGKELSEVNFNGKYTDLRLPLPGGMGYALKGTLRYGDLKYPKAGLKQSRYVKDHDNFEIEAVPEDGTNKLVVNIEAHDCRINLEN